MFCPHVASPSCGWEYARQMAVSAENSLQYWNNQEIGPAYALVSIAASIFADKEWYPATDVAFFIKVDFKKLQNSWRAYEIVIS